MPRDATLGADSLNPNPPPRRYQVSREVEYRLCVYSSNLAHRVAPVANTRRNGGPTHPVLQSSQRGSVDMKDGRISIPLLGDT